MSAPRLRMFAGPNGSGKSTIKSLVPAEWLGVYINPDDIQKQIAESGYLDLGRYGLNGGDHGILDYLEGSALLKKAGMAEDVRHLGFSSGRLDFSRVPVNAYLASVISDFVRRRLLERGTSFSFETVMSSPDKVELLELARRSGYRTYLYYIATDDPTINVARVKARVNLGGHDVPEDKIHQRYHRSLDLLLDAVRLTNRAYLFDNSRHGGEHLWVAEITGGQELELKCDPMPLWFQKAVWEKIQPEA